MLLGDGHYSSDIATSSLGDGHIAGRWPCYWEMAILLRDSYIIAWRWPYWWDMAMLLGVGHLAKR